MHLRGLTLLLLLTTACGDDDGGDGSCSQDTDCTGGLVCIDGMCGTSGGDAGARDASEPERDAAPGEDAGPDCAEDCGDGDCIAGECCAAASSCGGVCCAAADVCSFNVCVTPGDTCAGEEDCGEDEYCEPRLGASVDMCGAAPTTNGRCLPSPPACPDGTTPDPASPECVSECRFNPPSGALEVQLAYSWGGFDGDRAPPNVFDVRNSPIVINLDDDDCDGRITARDVPEIVVITSPDDADRSMNELATGDLVVLSVEEGALTEKWRVPGVAAPWTYPAAGNFHSAEGNEILICSQGRLSMSAYGVSDDGLVLLWDQPLERRGRNCAMPSLFDVDQDGDVEILTLDGLLDGETGEMEYPMPDGDDPSGYGIAADIDNDADHDLELVFADAVFDLVDGALVRIADGPSGADHVLVAQLDGTGGPEIVSVTANNHTLDVWTLVDGEVRYLREDLDINGNLDPARCGASSAGFTSGGGPPTAANVNDDGIPDIAIAGGVGYAVIDGASLINPALTSADDIFLWATPTVDCSSAQTGSSVFDFNGDGLAEVLYADEQFFRIYNGADGTVLFETCNTNGTILEQPIVADVDNDGQADIVVVSNARYRNCSAPDTDDATSGVRVFSSQGGDWVRTRRVWNQHAYHITNVGEDGSIPQEEEANWNVPALNNFRLNRQPGNEDAAPDVVLSLLPICGTRAISVTVRNLGESVLPAGVVVDLYSGPGTEPTPERLVASQLTTQTLYPAQSQVLEFDIPDELRNVIDDPATGAFAIATPPAGTPQCRAENNLQSLDRFCTVQ